jgi:peptidoglycan/LPS O-acetylase OafA/YrhL
MIGAPLQKAISAPVTTKDGGSAANQHSAKAHLGSLTSLRFLAAALVITHHVAVVFLKVPPSNLSFAQAVSFFFVLSGFILTYVHPELPQRKDVLQFWRARFARIYPAHFAGLMLACLLLPMCNPLQHLREFCANLFLVHSWIPVWPYFFGFNASSWSVSTEMFFYAFFPLLVFKLKKNWAPKLGISFGLVIGLMVLCATLKIPSSGLHVSAFALLYVFPLGRLFEFVLGMCCALVWEKFQKRNLNGAVATSLEAMTLGAAAAYMVFSSPVTAWMQTKPALEVPAIWLLYSGNCLFFAAMIVVFATQRGAISKLLSHKTLVWLGELSYAIYILHFPIMIWLLTNMKTFGLTPESASCVFVGSLLVISHVFFTYVERPLRALIVGKKDRRRVHAAPVS